MLDARSDMKQIRRWEHTNIRGHSTKFGRPGDLAPSGFAPLYWYKKKLLRYVDKHVYGVCSCTISQT